MEIVKLLMTCINIQAINMMMINDNGMHILYSLSPLHPIAQKKHEGGESVPVWWAQLARLRRTVRHARAAPAQQLHHLPHTTLYHAAPHTRYTPAAPHTAPRRRATATACPYRTAAAHAWRSLLYAIHCSTHLAPHRCRRARARSTPRLPIKDSFALALLLFYLA